MEVAEFRVGKISCAGCAKAIENALRRVAGVSTVAVTVPEKHVAVTFEPGTTSAAVLRAALEKAGYPPSA